MDTIKKHQWDYGTFDDHIVSVKATITEEPILEEPINLS